MAKTEKKIAVAEEKLSMNDRFPRNITLDVFNAWNTLRRSGDPALLVKKCRKSRPIIDRALNYGHVNDTKLIAKISEFFSNRLKEEETRGKELLQQANNSK